MRIRIRSVALLVLVLLPLFAVWGQANEGTGEQADDGKAAPLDLCILRR